MVGKEFMEYLFASWEDSGCSASTANCSSTTLVGLEGAIGLWFMNSMIFLPLTKVTSVEEEAPEEAYEEANSSNTGWNCC